MKNLKYILTYNGVDTEVSHLDIAWDKTGIQIDRDTVLWGISRTIGVNVQFVKQAKTIVETALHTDKLKANVLVNIYRRNKTSNQFELIFTGKICFTQPYIETRDYIQVAIIEGGIYADVANMMNTKFNIPFDGNTKLKYNGISSTFETVAQLQREQGFDLFDTAQLSSLAPNLADPLPVTFKENDFADYNGGYMKFWNYELDFSDVYNPVPIATTIYPVEVLKDCRLRFFIIPTSIKCYQKNSNGGWLTMRYNYRLYRNRGGVDTIIHQWGYIDIATADAPGDMGTFYLPTENYTSAYIDVLAGDKYWVGVKRSFLSSDDPGYVYQPTDVLFWASWDAAMTLKTEITAPLPEGEFDAMTALDLFTGLGTAIGNYPVKSDFLTDFENEDHGWAEIINQQLVFISGWTIRQSTDKVYLTTTLNDFVKFLRVTFGIGFGIEKINGVATMIIEPMEYFINSNNIYDLTHNDNERKNTLASDLIPSEIKIGYQKYEYDDTFGLDEFNGTLELKTPVTELTSTLDLISLIRADGAGIDYIRKMELSKNANNKLVLTSKDIRSDGGTFCVFSKLYSTGAIKYYESVNDYYVVTGVTYPQHQVNYFLSPKRCLLRNGNYIRSIMWGYDADYLRFLNTESNKNLISQLSASQATIEEDKFELISSIGTAIFEPNYYELSIPGRFSIIEFVDQFNSGAFNFQINSVSLNGVLISSNINIAYDQTSEIKLLKLV